MEAEPISDSLPSENSDISSQQLENLDSNHNDLDLHLHLQTLLEQGLPVFVFEDYTQK